MEGNNRGLHRGTIDENKVGIGEAVHCPMTKEDDNKMRTKEKEKRVGSFMTTTALKRSLSSNLTCTQALDLSCLGIVGRTSRTTR